MKIAQLLALILTALALVPVGAHLFALPNKMQLDQADYFVTQSIYRGWACFGIVLVGAILTTAVAAATVRSQLVPFALAIVSTLLMLATLAIYFAFTFPANQATANWTTMPDDWQFLRRQWEYSHAVNAAITFAAFCATSLSALLSRG
jgi:hypothetical protein